jgi:thiamine transport system substrate-binding protein
MELSSRTVIALGGILVILGASILYLVLQQPPPPRLIVYGPQGIEGMATALIDEFERRYNVIVAFVHYDMGSIGIANKLISEKGDPVADVIVGLPEFYAKQVLDADVLESYTPANLSMIPENEIWDKTGHIFPVDKGYVLITYNETIISEKGISIPTTLDDLLRPEYKGLVFYQDPSSSGTGLSFLVWVLSVKGTEPGFAFLRALEPNVRMHPSGWTTSIVALKAGEVAIGSMYNTDVEYVEVPHLKSAAVEGFVYREGIALVKGAKNSELAKKFIEFVLGVDGQNVVSPAGYMYPVNPGASSSSLSSSPRPQVEITFNPNIAGNVVEWLDRWRREVKAG